ncbi:MAG: DUF1036 domain-containing protein [Proteobacteria bacterium]|nr:DUF1036 domain-containing protein [Pseudomonadota bacterium]
MPEIKNTYRRVRGQTHGSARIARPRTSLALARVAIACALLALCSVATPAAADLKLCNSTPGRIGVAVGYQDGLGWTTEGWWTIAGERCETLLKGKLTSRFYYIHAVDYDRGGEWAGQTQMCLDDKAFTIRGNTDCETRGHKREGFMEVDTNDARDWTIRLAEPTEVKAPAQPKPPVVSGSQRIAD